MIGAVEVVAAVVGDSRSTWVNVVDLLISEGLEDLGVNSWGVVVAVEAFACIEAFEVDIVDAIVPLLIDSF